MFTILMLISHTISDFVIQTNDVVKLKSQMKLKGYLYHGVGFLVTSMLMIICVKLNNIPKLIGLILAITMIHLCIDCLKEFIQNYIKNKNNDELNAKVEIVLFLSDQLFHIITILLITNNVTLHFNILNEILLKAINNHSPFTQSDFKIIFIIAYIAFSGVYLIPLIFNLIYVKVNNYSDILNTKLKVGLAKGEDKFIDEVKTGKWIGILERILITVFIYNNQLSAIGFIIAVKSLARFKMLDNKIFSEYYLLGTLFSVAYTFSTYYILYKII
ncbi:DUF3307 domain-containing protein [Vallitalea sediminicola]